MSPRPYQLGRRQAQVDQSRRRVLDAARSLLGGAASGFSVDAVARAADVARATVYYQFGSRSGMLEALCDDLAEEARVTELAHAFEASDARTALTEFAGVFGRFWAVDRVAMRRLRAMAALDEEVAAVIEARDLRRLHALAALLGKLEAPHDAVRPIYALTAFETYDAIAGEADIDTAVPVVAELAVAALGMPLR